MHPGMLPIIAEYAIEASQRTQVVISTHSPEFLDAFTEAEPTVTVFHWEEGESHLYDLTPASLKRWLERFRLGELFTSGDLDALAAPELRPIADLDERLKDLPPEGAAVAADEDAGESTSA